MVNTAFTYLPTKHYNEDTAIHFLQANCQADWGKQIIGHTKHYELDTVATFPVNKEIVRWLSDCYGGEKLQFTHFNSCFLQGLINGSEGQEKQLNLLMHEDLLSIALIEQQRLKFINTFPQQSVQDVLYFSLFVAEELAIKPNELTLKIWGNSPKLLSSQELLTNYVREVIIGEPPTNLKYGDGFEALPANYAFDLFSVYFLIR